MTLDDLRGELSDEELFARLSGELQRLFPAELRREPEKYLAALAVAPRGLRAMAALHALDVSMTLDDLAWHFVRYPGEREIAETQFALTELKACAAAEVFREATALMWPHLEELRSGAAPEEPEAWLTARGVRVWMDPLDARMRAECERSEEYGLMAYWLSYAREHPERCVAEE